MSIESQGQEEAARREVIWKRGLYMLLLAIAFSAAHVVLNTLTVVQLVWLLLAGVSNPYLAGFGGSLAAWLAEAGRFMTCASEDKPFPWRPWPPSSS